MIIAPVVLRINKKKYAMSLIDHSPESVVARFVPIKGEASNVTYDKVEWTCDCGDYWFRRHAIDPMGCKHIQALKVSLRVFYSHGLLPAYHGQKTVAADTDWLERFYGTDKRD